MLARELHAMQENTLEQVRTADQLVQLVLFQLPDQQLAALELQGLSLLRELEAESLVWQGNIHLQDLVTD
jgi:hypothetical protein